MLENFNMKWERMEKEYWKMREDNERFRKNWEKNVRAMGAASFFGLDEDETDIVSDDSIVDVEYREVPNTGLFISKK